MCKGVGFQIFGSFGYKHMWWLHVNFVSLYLIYTFCKIFGYKSLLLTHGNKFLLQEKVSEKFTLL